MTENEERRFKAYKRARRIAQQNIIILGIIAVVTGAIIFAGAFTAQVWLQFFGHAILFGSIPVSLYRLYRAEKKINQQ